MPTIAFGDFLHLMMSELADTLDQSAAQANVARVRIDDIELDIPAHLHLLKQEGAADSGARADGATPQSQLIVALPSPREVLPAGRVGRIRVRFEPDDAKPSEGGTP